MNDNRTLAIFPVSDLHLNLNSYTPSPASRRADVVVLAGDILISPDEMPLLREFWPNQRIVYVPGPGEFRFKEVARAIKDYKVAAQSLGIDFLCDDKVDIEGVRFIGSTLWTDFAINGDQEAATAAAAFDMDYTSIKHDEFHLSPHDAISLHQASVNFINSAILGAENMKRVVVTHQAPSKNSLQAISVDLHPVGGSNLDQVVKNASLWIHGWLHFNVDYHIGECRVVCNSRGHINEKTDLGIEKENESFIEDLIIFPGENSGDTEMQSQVPNGNNNRKSIGDRIKLLLGSVMGRKS